MVFGRAGPLHDVFENLKDAERHPHNQQGSFSERAPPDGSALPGKRIEEQAWLGEGP